MLEEKILNIKRELVEYAGLIEKMLAKTMEGLLKKNKKLLEEVIDKDEPKANKIEIELDDHGTGLIAQFEPRAKDLRTVLMVLKMNNDLERMGDHVVNIAESAQFLIERPPVKPYQDIPQMGETTAKMLHDGISAFINEDAVLAKQVCERDDIVDNLHDQILRELITYMSSDPTTIERALHLLRISNNLERIADLSTNIGEDVLFMVQGRVIKHHREEKQS
jgi:phosphate transport system protein